MKGRGRQLAWECDKNSKGKIIIVVDFEVEGQFKDRSCQGSCLLHIATLCMNMTGVWIGCRWITWHSRIPLHQPHELLTPTDQRSKWRRGGAAAPREGPRQGGHRTQRWGFTIVPKTYLFTFYSFIILFFWRRWTEGCLQKWCSCTENRIAKGDET